MDGESPDPIPPGPAPQKKHGCFFYGCLTGVILMVVVLVGGLVLAKIMLGKANQFLALYTDTNSVPLPKTELSVDQIKSVVERTAAFSDAMDGHSNAPSLVLTGPEINALLENQFASNPRLANFKGQIFVSLDQDQAGAQFSLSLDKIRFPGLHTEGRYLNGNGTFAVSVKNGMLDIHVNSLTVKGKPTSPGFLKMFQQKIDENADRGDNTNFSQIESLVVTNSTLVIKARSD